MIIGHLPAAYLLGSLVSQRLSVKQLPANRVVLVCIAGGLAPDLDMLYFYLIDQRQHHHHTYLSHWPIMWASILVAGAIWQEIRPQGSWGLVVILFSFGALVHLVLDSVVGGIWWFAPFIDRPYALFSVTARYDPWWLNFVFHWSFFLEL